MLTNLGSDGANVGRRNAVVELLQQRVHYRDLRVHVYLPVLYGRLRTLAWKQSFGNAYARQTPFTICILFCLFVCLFVCSNHHLLGHDGSLEIEVFLMEPFFIHFYYGAL